MYLIPDLETLRGLVEYANILAILGWTYSPSSTEAGETDKLRQNLKRQIRSYIIDSQIRGLIVRDRLERYSVVMLNQFATLLGWD